MEADNVNWLRLIYNYPRTTTRDEYKRIHRYLRISAKYIQSKYPTEEINKKLFDLIVYGRTVSKWKLNYDTRRI